MLCKFLKVIFIIVLLHIYVEQLSNEETSVDGAEQLGVKDLLIGPCSVTASGHQLFHYFWIGGSDQYSPNCIACCHISQGMKERVLPAFRYGGL